MLVTGAPGWASARAIAIDPELQCMPWDVPQNVRDGEGASNWDLYERPVGILRGAVSATVRG